MTLANECGKLRSCIGGYGNEFGHTQRGVD